MMRVLMRSAAASLLIAAGFFFVPGASAQLQSPSPGLSQQPQNIPDQKLDAAAAAIERVASLKQDYQQRVAAAAPADKERILNDAVNALAKAVTDQGLSVEEYDSILEVAQNDPDVREKIRQRIRPSAPIATRVVTTGWPASLRSWDLQGSDRSHGRLAMQIKRHDMSHLVELRNGSAWRIWPGDIPKTLQWLPTTEIDVTDIDDELCPHALIDRSNGLQVRVINANENCCRCGPALSPPRLSSPAASVPARRRTVRLLRFDCWRPTATAMSGNDWYSPKHEAEAAKACRVYFPIVTSIMLSVVSL
jgi:Domain of unknown function (DUF4168)